MLSSYRIYHYDQMSSPVVTAGTHAVLIGALNDLFPEASGKVENVKGKPQLFCHIFRILHIPGTAADTAGEE